jgi:hypothetical protein
MPLSFPTNPTPGQTYSSGSSAVYQWNGQYWDLSSPPVVTTEIAISASSALTSSYALTASYLEGGPPGAKNITSISLTGYTSILAVADNTIYNFKGNDGFWQCYVGAVYPTVANSGLFRGIINGYEIPIPQESGILLEAGTYGQSAYALFSNGNLYTWGYNAQGQLGVGDTTARFYPTLAQTDVVEVYTHESNATGFDEYVRLVIKKTDGKIYGCGYNGNYELGLGDTTNRTSFSLLNWMGTNPLSVWNLGGYKGNIFGQKAADDPVFPLSIVVSGGNANGQMGRGNTTVRTSGGAVPDSGWLASDETYRVEAMFHGGRTTVGDNHCNIMLLRNASGTRIAGAGYNNYGQLGLGNTTQQTIPQAPIGTWTTVSKLVGIGGSVSSIYALKEDGTLWTWGYNGYGQLDTGNTTTPVSTPGQRETGVLDILPSSQGYGGGTYESPSPIFRKSDGYYCCGRGDLGGTGTGTVTTTNSSLAKMRFPSGTEIKLLGQTTTDGGNGYVFMAVDTSNQIWAWGYNAQLMIDPNDTTLVAQPTPITPPSLLR